MAIKFYQCMKCTILRKLQCLTRTLGQGALFELCAFLKLKTEASGFPHDCKTEEEKHAFVERFLEREGIQLDPNNIKKNPGMRSLSKLCLNSFWGNLDSAIV